MLRHATLAAALAALLALDAHAGCTITTVTKVEGAHVPQNLAAGLTSTVSFDGDRMRAGIPPNAMAPQTAGGYLLTTDAGKTLYMVMPQSRSYMEWNVEKFVGSTMAQMRGMMNLTFTGVNSQKITEEKGPDIQGYPTTHYIFRTSYQTEMSMFGQTMVNSVSQDDEVWTTTKLASTALEAWARKQLPSTGDEGLDKLIATQQAQMKGIPLRRIVTASQTDASGQTQVTKTTTEVTAIKEGDLPPATFEIPPGYQLTEMSASPAAGIPAPR